MSGKGAKISFFAFYFAYIFKTILLLSPIDSYCFVKLYRYYHQRISIFKDEVEGDR